MQIVSTEERQFARNAKSCFLGKIRKKKNQNVVCLSFTRSAYDVLISQFEKIIILTFHVNSL